MRIYLLAIASTIGIGRAEEPSSRLGIVSQQPARGIFVKVDRGYMVPYTETVPGTNTEEGFARGGLKQPSAFGLYGMHGNVGEWTVNAFTDDGYAWLAKKRQPLDAIDTIRWPQQATSCVVRGGVSDSRVIIDEDLLQAFRKYRMEREACRRLRKGDQKRSLQQTRPETE